MTWILRNKRISLIIALFLCLLFSLGYANHLKGQLLKAESACTAKIDKIHSDNAKAIADQQNKLNQASIDYEKLKSEQRVKTETITREVQKIIERPIYLNTCFDADGVSAINSLIPQNTS